MNRYGRPASQPPVNRATTTSAASAAASLAFAKKQQADANLSAAAAAAALRSHTATPTAIGDIQTRRMMRRGSTSSFGSIASSVRPASLRPSLQRRGSSSSMTERTFRSPSPGGRNRMSITGTVPATPPMPSQYQRRSGSFDVPAGRVISPTPSTGGRVAAPGRAPRTTLANVPEQQVLDTPSSRPQVNFSRPMSPPPVPTAPKQGIRARPASSQGFYSAQNQRSQPPAQQPRQPATAQTPRATQQARAKPVQKSNAATAPGASVTPVAARAKPTTSASRQSLPPAQARPASSAGTASTRLSAASAARPVSQISSPINKASPATQRNNTAVVSDGTSTRNLPQMNTATGPPTTAAVSVPSPSNEQMRVFHTRAAALLSQMIPEMDTMPANQRNRSTSQPVGYLTAQTVPASTLGSGNVHRAPSVSPARSARFSDAPLLDTVRHQPPPRATSPAKPALKPSSIRTSSPDGSRHAVSDNSDSRSVKSVESTSRKKKARVNFDDKPEIVQPGVSGVSASTKALWMGSQEGMGTRPALPTFDSVRGRKGTRDPPSSTAGVPDVLSMPARSDARMRVESLSTPTDAQGQFSSSTEFSRPTADSVPTTIDALGIQNGPASQQELPAANMAASDSLEGSGDQLDSSHQVPLISVVPSTPARDEHQYQTFEFSTVGGRVDDKDLQGIAQSPELPPAKQQIYQGAGLPRSEILPEQEPSNAIGSFVTPEPRLNTVVPAVNADWDSIGAYWSVQRKRQVEAEAGPNRLEPVEHDDDASVYSNREPQAPDTLQTDDAYVAHEAFLPNDTVPRHESGLDHESPPTFSMHKDSTAHDDEPTHETFPTLEHYLTPEDVPKEDYVTAQGADPSPLPPWPDRQYQAYMTDIHPAERPTAYEREGDITGPASQRYGASTLAAAQQSPRGKFVRGASESEDAATRPQSAQVAPSTPTQQKDRPRSYIASGGPALSGPTGTRVDPVTGTALPAPPRASVAGPAPVRNSVPAPARTPVPAPARMAMGGPAVATSGPPTGTRVNPAVVQPPSSTSRPLKGVLKNANAPRPEMTRTFSNSSDSDDSFRRRRRATANSRASMKTSMRASGPRGAGASPAPGARAYTNSPNQSSTSLRTSMRTSAAIPNQPGMHRTPNSRASVQKPVGSTGRAKLANNYDDSSDEEDARPTRMFRSRFADSDDEDHFSSPTKKAKSGLNFGPLRSATKQAPPVRAPAAPAEQESSRFSRLKRVVSPPTANGHAPNSGQGAALTTGTMRSSFEHASPTARRGLFGMGKKKNAGTDLDLDADYSLPTTPAKPVRMLSTMRAPEAPAPVESTPRSSVFRSTSSARPGSTTPIGGRAAANHPYPPPPIPDHYKPLTTQTGGLTAEGLSAAMLAAEQHTAANGGRADIYSMRTGKKKKFQGLRRVFGLMD